MEDNNASTGAESAVSESTESADVSQAVVDADESGQASEVSSSTKKRFKLKVDGQEIEEELDLSDEEAIKRHLQMSKASQKRMQEAAMTRKQAEEFIRLLKSNPVQVLSNPQLGIDFRKLAEEYLAEQIEQEFLTPEERKLREYESRLKEYEEAERQKREREQAEQIERLQSHYAEDYQKKILTALDSGGLPKSPKTVKRMAELMYKNLEYGFDLEPAQLVEMVREDYLSEIRQLVGAADGDTLLRILGDDTANKIRKSDLKRLKSTMPSGSHPSESGSIQKSDVKPLSKEEWRESLEKRFRK